MQNSLILSCGAFFLLSSHLVHSSPVCDMYRHHIIIGSQFTWCGGLGFSEADAEIQIHEQDAS